MTENNTYFVFTICLTTVVVIILMIGFWLGVAYSLDQDTVQSTVEMMLKDPSQAKEILRSGKRVMYKIDGSFAPGDDLSAIKYKELMTYVEK